MSRGDLSEAEWRILKGFLAAALRIAMTRCPAHLCNSTQSFSTFVHRLGHRLYLVCYRTLFGLQRMKGSIEFCPAAPSRICVTGIEPQCNGIWAVVDVTEENGATNIVPGSHKWPFSRQARRDESIPAVMKAGSVLLYNGTVIHSGGENRSDKARKALNITYTLGWLRQEENQYLSCPPEIAKHFDQELTDLLGYSFGNYSLGFFTDPTKSNQFSDILPPEVAVDRWPREIPEMVETDASPEIS